MVEVDTHEEVFRARVIDSALEREILDYISTHTYRGFKKPFCEMSYRGDVTSKIVTIFPSGVGVDSIDVIDCEYELGLATIGRKYGLELVLPEFAYDEE